MSIETDQQQQPPAKTERANFKAQRQGLVKARQYQTQPNEANWQAALAAMEEIAPALHPHPLDVLEETLHAAEAKPAGQEHDALPALREAWERGIAYLKHHRPLNWQSERPNPAPRRWIVKHWLPEGRVCLFAGPGGTGKSALALQLALSIARPERFWIAHTPLQIISEGVTRQKTVFASWEDSHADLERRLRAMNDGQGEPSILTVDLADAGPLYGPGEGKHTSTLAEFKPLWEKLAALCQDQQARLLIIDALSSAFASNENDRGLVRGFMAPLDNWARQTQTAIVLIAHPSKQMQAAFSGSTDWPAAARVAWTLSREPLPGTSLPPKSIRKKLEPSEQASCLTLEKSNYGPTHDKEGLPLRYFLEWQADKGYARHTQDIVANSVANQPANEETAIERDFDI